MNLFTRFPIRRTIPLCLLLGALLAEGYTMKYNQNLADAEEEKEAFAFVTQDVTQLQENIGNRLRKGDWEGVQSAIAIRGSNRNVTVAVLADDAGTVIGSTSLKLIGVSISQALPDVDAALLREVGATLAGRVFLSHDRKLVTACYPVILGAKGVDIRPHRVGIVCLRYDLTYAKALRRHGLERQALVMAGFYAGGSLLLGLLLHLALTRRVSRLVSAAKRIAAGDLSAQTGLQGEDELAQIGGAFDRMAGEIARGHVALQKAAVEYRIVADNAYDWEFWLSPANEFIYISPSCKRITGYDADEFRADPGLMGRVVHPDDRSRLAAHRHDVVQRMLSEKLEYRIVGPDGTIRWIDHVCQPVFNEKGDFLGTRGSNRDISERKLAEESLRCLNRELRAISHCNQVLVRAEDEQTLLNDICRIVCDEAGYRMAWVGYAESDVARTIRPVAWAGAEDGYLEQAGLTWADTERGRGPSGVAIRSGESACIQDFTTDPQAAPWRDGALQRGCRSAIALPLKDEDAITFGVLCIYCAMPNAFTPDEIRLLEELSGDLAFGVMVLRARIERKRAEEKERLLSAIVQSSDDAIIAKDLDGVILSWNRGAERIFGYSAEEAVGKSVSMVIPPDHPNELAEILTHLRRGERVEHYTTERLRKDGQRISVSLTVSPILNGAGNIVGASTIARDITDRKLAEEALRKSERDLKEAQRIAQIGSWDWDATTDTIAWSEEYCRIYNVDPNAPTPSYLEHLKMYTDESAKRLAAEVAKTMQTGQPYKLELELANPDVSRRWSFVRGEAKYDADRQIVGLHGTAQNITQRKLAELEILRLNADLEQRVLERTAELEKTYHELEEETAQRLLALEELRKKERMLLQQSRLAALGEMISNIAHQWRQPLNELGLIVQELPMMYEKGNLDRDYLNASVARFMKLLSHTSKTIDDFRDFFKPDEEKVPFKVQEMVGKTVSLIEESFRQLRITIAVKAAGEPVITGHPNEFSQVILNILFNARDAFLAGKDGRPRVIAIEIFSEGGRGVVTVADNAGGIPAAILDKIFDPYFTTRGPEQGTGIGLYMSKIIIEKNMPGRLSVRNTAEGAEFRIEV